MYGKFAHGEDDALGRMSYHWLTKAAILEMDFDEADVQSARLCTCASVRLLVGRVRVYGPTYSTSIASKQECHCHRPGVSLALGGARIPVFLPFRGVKLLKISRLRRAWPPAAPAAG